MSHKYATVAFANAEPTWLASFEIVTPWYAEDSPNMPTLWCIEDGNMTATKEQEIISRGGQVFETSDMITEYLTDYGKND